MAIVLIVRKILLAIWKFAHAKKKRTPSTLPNCKEDSQPKYVVVFFRPWLITVLGVALMYIVYVIITHNSSDQTKNEDIQVLRSVSNGSAVICGLGCNLEEVSNKTKTKISDLLVPDRSRQSPPPVQCSLPTPRGRVGIRHGLTQLDSSYRKQIKPGGYYEPSGCKARDKVAIIVPYRDRETNLIVFLYSIHPFLINQKLKYRIFVIEQNGHEKFNKGRLYNAGFDQAHRIDTWRCVVFHNVNLLPLDERILYTCPADPTQMSVMVVQFNKVSLLESPFGGVTAMTREHFQTVNGYSNLYWGSAAGADLDMFWRLRATHLPIKKYKKTGVYTLLPHPNDKKNPRRHELNSTGDTENRYETDGVSNSRYEIISIKLRSLYTHIVVDINPNKESTE